MPKNKHLTDIERNQIQQWLREGISIREMARRLEKVPSTISREIRSKVVHSQKVGKYRILNNCVKRQGCNVKNLCKSQCKKTCSLCNVCNEICDAFEAEVCYRLYDAPYVCNGCTEEHRCTLDKKFYIGKQAHTAYRELLVEARIGVNITESELEELDKFVSPLIKQGQSIHHIVSNNEDMFNRSEKTIYRYVDSSLLNARNIDMPRVCRLKQRRGKRTEHKVDKSCRIGRTYEEFLVYTQNADIQVVEMDSVEGRKGGKVLLTLMFKSCDLMLAFLRDHNNSKSVISIFEWMYEILGADTFKKIFPVILTDNGSEFSNPVKLETDAQGNKRTIIFYCDPCASFQKANVELNHEFIRRILKKGTSFDELTQNDIDLMMSHINSYSRDKLGDKTPFDVFSFLYGNDILSKLGQSKIPANEIILRPSLLKNNR